MHETVGPLELEKLEERTGGVNVSDTNKPRNYGLIRTFEDARLRVWTVDEANPIQLVPNGVVVPHMPMFKVR